MRRGSDRSVCLGCGDPKHVFDFHRFHSHFPTWENEEIGGRYEHEDATVVYGGVQPRSRAVSPGIRSHRWHGIWRLPISSSTDGERSSSRQRSVDRPDNLYRSSWRNWPSCGVLCDGVPMRCQVTQEHDRRQTYGSPSIRRAFRKKGHRVGEHRVARLMRHDGLRAKTVKQWETTASSSHGLPASSGCHSPTASDSVISSIYGFWRAGCIWPVLLDLYSRAVIGWVIGPRLTGDLPEQALRMALTTRQPTVRLLHHSARSRIRLQPRCRYAINHGAAQNIINGNLDNSACCNDKRVSFLN